MTNDGHDGGACYLATEALLLEMAVWRQWVTLEQMRRLALGLAAWPGLREEAG